MPPSGLQEERKQPTKAVVTIGNSGSGKSYLLNRMVDESQFEHRFSPGSVTPVYEKAEGIIEGEHYVLMNVPGLLEARAKNIERNKRELKRALADADFYKLLFVMGSIGGRLQDADITAYKVFVEAYGLRQEQVPIVLNNVPGHLLASNPEYETECRVLLAEFGIHAPTILVTSDDPEAQNKLIRMLLTFEWYRVTKTPKELVLDRNNEAIQALMGEVSALQAQMAEQAAADREERRKMAELHAKSLRDLQESHSRRMDQLRAESKQDQKAANEQLQKLMADHQQQQARMRREHEANLGSLRTEWSQKIERQSGEMAQLRRDLQAQKARAEALAKARPAPPPVHVRRSFCLTM